MIGYHISLYIHLLALVAASAISALVHLGKSRARRAASLAEAREWLGLVKSSARFFPLATLTLFATGAHMVSVNSPWSWTTGWVDAGITGVVFLLLSGAVLGARGARTGRALAGLRPGDAQGIGALLHDPVAAALSSVNTGVALGVVFAMAVKPSFAASLAALAVGAVAALALHLVSERRAVAVPVRADLAA
jgi:hypothetical protein